MLKFSLRKLLYKYLINFFFLDYDERMHHNLLRIIILRENILLNDPLGKQVTHEITKLAHRERLILSFRLLIFTIRSLASVQFAAARTRCFPCQSNDYQASELIQVAN